MSMLDAFFGKGGGGGGFRGAKWYGLLSESWPGHEFLVSRLV
jgi:vacuolar protein sorting-associated protein IST1